MSFTYDFWTSYSGGTLETDICLGYIISEKMYVADINGLASQLLGLNDITQVGQQRLSFCKVYLAKCPFQIVKWITLEVQWPQQDDAFQWC